MKTLWFKTRYAEEILLGGKRHTDRVRVNGLASGMTVAASIGPRPPFAHLHITRIAPVPDDDPETVENRAIYGDAPVMRIEFDLVPISALARSCARDAQAASRATEPAPRTSRSDI